MERSRLARLQDFGQSVWCDDIGRDLLMAGRLKTLIEQDGVSGVTSNPTIFYRAITESSAYDDDVRELTAAGAGATEIMEALMVSDIRTAGDQLRPVFEATSRRDGWVSIEVAPALAYDTQGTVVEALRMRDLVDRPNLLVKVPATAEGVAAISDLTGSGCSVNVTLIFSLERYRQVMEAYVSGLEALVARGRAGDDVPGPGEVHSVASFFISRIDTMVDGRLAALAEAGAGENGARLRPMRGKAALAAGKQAYQIFRETFAGARWEALKAEGATLQRPLWASTSTKDPAYSDVLYVQELIGSDTVNTMPLATMDAFRDHGEPAETVTVGVEEAAYHLAELDRLGIDLGEIGAQLEHDGVRAFADSFESLQLALEAKRSSVLP